MLLKNIEPGREYLALRYASPGRRVAARDPLSEWQRLARDAVRIRVDEVGVEVAGYSRLGLRGVEVSMHTGEPQVYASGPAVPWQSLAGQIIMPWDEWARAHHEKVTEVEEEAERLRVKREHEQARRQEEMAKRWMEQEFERARQDIREVVQVVGRRNDLLGAAEYPITDEHVQALVDLRHPDGNPYLNGTYKAHG